MERLVKVRLDGKTIEVPEGSTILEAAKREGIHIPTLCYSPLLPPLENCRLCVVAVAGERQYKAACSTVVSDGMEVTTQNDDLMQTRKLLLELLLDTHYGDCVAPCTLTCPANVDIQGYLALIRAGEYLEAVKLIKEKIPMPATIGRVCPHPCEGACRRHLVDEPVNINHCKRFVADYEIDSGRRVLPAVAESTGRRVAIVGGGPAGLSAAYYLRALGYGTTIFEAKDKLGGMLRYGIPEYRLPKKILDWEIEGILGLGVEVKTGVRWGQDFTLDDLKKEGFDAIFLAIGAWGTRKLGIVGEDLQGVISGVEFLERIADGESVPVGRRVVIIGGGNVAIDAARSVLRLGAEKVTILYRRSRKEMPASHEEIEAAEAEGVDIQLLAAPTRALGEDGVLRQLEFIRMELGEPDASGRRRPVPIEGSETFMEVDQLISAIGQVPQVIVPEQDGVMENIPVTRWSTVGGDPRSMHTGYETVFVGGDLFQGPMTVVAALADGRKAAYSLNRFFEVGEVQPEPLHFNISKGDLETIDREPFEAMKTVPRERMPELAAAKRVGDFREVELGLSEEQAQKEAQRCLVCGCSAAFDCRLRERMNEFQVDWRDQPSKKIHYQRVAAIDTHPLIALDPNKCIRCERCVTACDLFQCFEAIDFKDWPRLTERCEACGMCVDLCPTGALMEKRDGHPVDRLDWRTVATHCIHCGCGCQLDLKLKGERLVWIADGHQGPPSDATTCQHGRFHSYDTHWYGSRIKKPLLRKGGELQAVSWGQAIDAVLTGFREAAEESGTAVGALASPRATNEALYLLQKWMRLGWRSNQLDFPGRAPVQCYFGLVKSAGFDRVLLPMESLDTAQAIVVWGGGIDRIAPVVSGRIKRAAKRRGIPVYLVGNPDDRLKDHAAGIIAVEPAAWSRVADGLAAALVPGAAVDDAVVKRLDEVCGPCAGEILDASRLEIEPDTAAGLLQAMKSAAVVSVFAVPPVIAWQEDEWNGFLQSLLRLGVLTSARNRGSGLVSCLGEINVLGALLMGVTPDSLAGLRSLDDADALAIYRELMEDAEIPGEAGSGLAAAIDAGTTKAVLALEPSLLWEREQAAWQQRIAAVPFLVVVDSIETAALDTAQVVLPMAAFGEQVGTLVNHERRVLHLAQAMAVDGEALSDWEIVSQLLATQGLPFPRDLNAVRSEISRVVREFDGFAWEERDPAKTLLK